MYSIPTLNTCKLTFKAINFAFLKYAEIVKWLKIFK